MTIEKLQQIETAAREMVGEIEWVGIFGPGDDSDFRAMMTGVLADADFLRLVREILDAVFAYLRTHLNEQPGHQEVDLEAAGIVKSATKKAVMLVSPQSAEFLRSLQLTAKFKRIPLPTTQAPRHVFVPSMRDQMAGFRPFVPGGGDA